MTQIDFQAPAELYVGHQRGKRNKPLQYKRFDSTAEAIRFVMEEMTPDTLSSTVIECEDARLTSEEIRDLYGSDGYPLPRQSRQT